VQYYRCPHCDSEDVTDGPHTLICEECGMQSIGEI
jgi:uncharacterized Zn ribbon protein